MRHRLLYLLCFVIPFTSAHRRCDVKSVWERHALTCHDFPDIAQDNLHLARLQNTLEASIASPFNVTFTCTDVSPALCTKARSVFDLGLKRISDTLVINTPITIDATYKSFCENTTAVSCSLANVLGQASASAFFTGIFVLIRVMLARRDASVPFTYYPQALIKQLSKNTTLVYREYDLIIELNADYDFWYRNDTEAITPEQIDFEFVVAHELTHGLGFQTNWVKFGDLVEGLSGLRSDWMSPFVNFVDSQVENVNALKVKSWQPISVFDLHLRNEADSVFAAPYNAIVGYSPGDQLLAPFLTNFQSSGNAYTSAQNVNKALTAGGRGLTFKANSSDTPKYLFCPRTYTSGSSVAHMDFTTYSSTSDFLMIHAVSNLAGSTVDELIAKSSGNGIYGPGILQIMSALGWASELNNKTIYSISVSTSDDASLWDFGDGRFGSGNSAKSQCKYNFYIMIVLMMIVGNASI